MKTLRLLFAGSAAILLSASLLAQPKAKPWDVPANFKSMKNPVAVSDASKKAGQTLYTKNCASCHGKTGLGDGVKARSLKDFPGDFSKADFQSQSDGALFYKTKFGRAEMPKYDGKLSDDDIWSTVITMKSFKK